MRRLDEVANDLARDWKDNDMTTLERLPDALARRRQVIGRNVRLYRLRRDITQAQLARQLGLSRALINRYEGGRVEPADDTLVAIAQALGVSADDLLTVR